MNDVFFTPLRPASGVVGREGALTPPKEDWRCSYCSERASHFDQAGRPRCTWCRWEDRIFHRHSPWSWLRWMSSEMVA